MAFSNKRAVVAGKTAGLSLLPQHRLYGRRRPIVIDGVHLANWLIGQNCIGTVDAERVAAYAEDKKINDTYGHQFGDSVLQQVVATSQQLIRHDIDWLARYGGEEFLVVMPLTSRAGGIRVAERLRQAIANISFTGAGEQVSITASFGITGIDSWEGIDTISHETLLQSADTFLYSAKKGGRNQVVSDPVIMRENESHSGEDTAD